MINHPRLKFLGLRKSNILSDAIVIGEFLGHVLQLNKHLFGIVAAGKSILDHGDAIVTDEVGQSFLKKGDYFGRYFLPW